MHGAAPRGSTSMFVPGRSPAGVWPAAPSGTINNRLNRAIVPKPLRAARIVWVELAAGSLGQLFRSWASFFCQFSAAKSKLAMSS